MNDTSAANNQVKAAANMIHKLKQSMEQVVYGQSAVVDQVLIGFLSGGHVLVEGVPGLGKTLLVRALAGCFGGQFKRVQFTPDLMPADITGHVLYDMKEGKFSVRKGPVFTNLLLADEINRAPAKTQAALLEVMQEQQVTIEGEPQPLPRPFMVLATQNPIEQEGTYPLPEAELDRFLMKIRIDYPSQEDEIRLTRVITASAGDNGTAGAVKPFLDANLVMKLQQLMPSIMVDEQVLEYAVRLVRATRENPSIANGAGPRASIALVRCARAHALLRGENFVLPDDVKAVALPVMRHRIGLTANVEMEGLDADHILTSILDAVNAPRM